MFKQLFRIFAFAGSLLIFVACGGVETDDDLATSEDAVRFIGIDGSQQECATCHCGEDNDGNCVVYDEWWCYYAPCANGPGGCTENVGGGVTFTPPLQHETVTRRTTGGTGGR